MCVAHQHTHARTRTYNMKDLIHRPLRESIWLLWSQHHLRVPDFLRTHKADLDKKATSRGRCKCMRKARDTFPVTTTPREKSKGFLEFLALEEPPRPTLWVVCVPWIFSQSSLPPALPCRWSSWDSPALHNTTGYHYDLHCSRHTFIISVAHSYTHWVLACNTNVLPWLVSQLEAAPTHKA